MYVVNGRSVILMIRMDLIDILHEAILVDAAIKLELLLIVVVHPIYSTVRALPRAMPTFLHLDIVFRVYYATCIFRVIIGSPVFRY